MIDSANGKMTLLSLQGIPPRIDPEDMEEITGWANSVSTTETCRN